MLWRSSGEAAPYLVGKSDIQHEEDHMTFSFDLLETKCLLKLTYSFPLNHLL